MGIRGQEFDVAFKNRIIRIILYLRVVFTLAGASHHTSAMLAVALAVPHCIAVIDCIYLQAPTLSTATWKQNARGPLRSSERKP